MIPNNFSPISKPKTDFRPCPQYKEVLKQIYFPVLAFVVHLYLQTEIKMDICIALQSGDFSKPLNLMGKKNF